MGMNLTPEQHEAVYTFDCNLIVTAGAGSGKTRVLVERFMALLEAYANWSLRQIVAITFTEKAAREMRDRVRQGILARIKKLQAGSPEAERWREHEANLDSVRIGTIHSLCAQILRANPVESRLDPGFEVLDEVEANLLRRDAVEKALADVADGEVGATELLLNYEVRQVRDALTQFASVGLGGDWLNTPFDVNKLWNRWHDLREQDSQQVMQALRNNTAFLEALYWIDSWENPPQDDKLWSAWEVVLEYRDAILSVDPATVEEALQQFADGKVIDLRGGSQKNWGGKDILGESKEKLKLIRDTAREHLDKLLMPPLSEIDEQAAHLLELWRRAIVHVRAVYQAAKEQQNMLDFDDLEYQTSRLLKQHPQVARRYADPEQGEFKHIMVDEFQDTNARQRDIVYALCGLDPKGDDNFAGRLFVVGDPKQSIYAFRGADISVFNEVQREIEDTGGVRLPLSLSFRSHSRLVDMFNYSFERILKRQIDSPSSNYMVELGMKMQAVRDSEDFHELPLNLILLQKPDKDAYGKWSSEDMRYWEASELASTIKRVVEEKRLVWDKQARQYREIQYGDVVLLFQSLYHTHIYEAVFQSQGLPYITIAGRGYYEQQEVADLMNLLRVLHNSADDLALASVLRSPIFGVSDDTLYALRLRRDEDGKRLLLWRALYAEESQEDWPSLVPRDEPVLALARKVLGSLHELAGRVTIAELLAIALDKTAFEATMTGLPNGERRRANINKLLEVARQSERVSLGEFNAYLRDVVSSEAREGEANLDAEGVIQLMSVHASKGLEFPVVVLPDSAWSRRPDEPVLVADAELELVCKVPVQHDGTLESPVCYRLAMKYAGERDFAERQRLLYVAATRAQDYLIISGQYNEPKDDAQDWLSQWVNALEFDMEIATQETSTIQAYQWGNLAITLPSPPADVKQLRAAKFQQTPWDNLKWVDADLNAKIDLPLLKTLPDPAERQARHIAATDLEWLGRSKYINPEAAGQMYFRNRLLRDIPHPVPPFLHQTPNDHQLANIIGEVVHRALKVGLSIESPNLNEALEAYAWENHITDRVTLTYVIERARQLLADYEHSSIARELAAASQLYREIEFVHEIGHVIVHGIIDVLYFDQKREWHVLDYKTSGTRNINSHAQRYKYQLGAYALAVEKLTGKTPQTHLYYLHSSERYTMHEKVWRRAMESLPLDIEQALSYSEVKDLTEL